MALLNDCERKLKKFDANNSARKVKPFAAGSKSDVCIQLGKRPQGVSLYRLREALSVREGGQWGTPPSYAYVYGSWVAPSYLGVRGYSCRTEYQTVAAYLAQFKGDEKEIEKAAFPKAALERPSETETVVIRFYEGLPDKPWPIDTGRDNVAPAETAAPSAPEPSKGGQLPKGAGARKKAKAKGKASK
jgi:hypothetical protein